MIIKVNIFLILKYLHKFRDKLDHIQFMCVFLTVQDKELFNDSLLSKLAKLRFVIHDLD